MRTLGATVLPQPIRRDPERTVLHRTLRNHLQEFLQRMRESDTVLPRFVQRELEAYLECGILAHGFVRVRCASCRYEHPVAFSCKRRGFCPSCTGRRMNDTAAHLVDRVLPEVPVRQWVMSFPHGLRYRLAYDGALCSAVLREFTRTVFCALRRRARGELPIPARQMRCGSVTFIQRFGDGARLNLHFHALILDGVYVCDPKSPLTPPRFHALSPPSDSELARVAQAFAERLRRLLRRWELDPDTQDPPEDPLARDQPALAALYSASVRGRTVFGPRPGMPLARLGDRIDVGDLQNRPGQLCVSVSGINLHAGVSIPAHDRRRLERLCRYVARGPLASERLHERPDGGLLYELKSRWRDGTTHLLFSPLELIGRLASLIPPPRRHQVVYHGILSSACSLRDAVVPASAHPTGQTTDGASTDSSDPPPRASRPRRLAWAELLRRVFGADLKQCPRCGEPLRIIAVIRNPLTAAAILSSLGLPARAPPQVQPSFEELAVEL